MHPSCGYCPSKPVGNICLSVTSAGSPGGRGLPLHLLAVPHFDGAVVGRSGEDGVLVGDADAVNGGFVLMKVGDQQAFGMPT